MKSASGAPCDPLYLVVEPGTRSKTARISQERVLPFPPPPGAAAAMATATS